MGRHFQVKPREQKRYPVKTETPTRQEIENDLANALTRYVMWYVRRDREEREKDERKKQLRPKQQ